MKHSFPKNFEVIKLRQYYNKQQRIGKYNKAHRKCTLYDIVNHLEKVENYIINTLNITAETIEYPSRRIFIIKLHLGFDQTLYDFFMDISIDAHEDQGADVLSYDCGDEAEGHDQEEHGHEGAVVGEVFLVA